MAAFYAKHYIQSCVANQFVAFNVTIYGMQVNLSLHSCEI